MSENSKKVIEVNNLDISFRMPGSSIHAIRGIDFSLGENEVLALVGESGCGKSISVKTIMGILPENAVIHSGEILYHGKDGTVDLLKKKSAWRQKNINGSKIAMVFQDPMTSLNPTMTIGKQLITSIRDHGIMSKKDAYARSIELLMEVGIVDPQRTMDQYPHQLSGGMRQRVVIAIALSCNPEILICDEPTTALDVTIQDRILELIRNIQKTRGISVIFITHNLGVVAKLADYVGVMYAGKIIEYGTIFDIFYDPRHPYTWGLLSAVPTDTNEEGDLYSIPGTPPNLAKEIVGDAFAPRNPYALAIDFKAEPPLKKISQTHYAATWLLDERAPKVEMPDTLKKRIMKLKEEAKAYVRSED